MPEFLRDLSIFRLWCTHTPEGRGAQSTEHRSGAMVAHTPGSPQMVHGPAYHSSASQTGPSWFSCNIITLQCLVNTQLLCLMLCFHSFHTCTLVHRYTNNKFDEFFFNPVCCVLSTSANYAKQLNAAPMRVNVISNTSQLNSVLKYSSNTHYYTGIHQLCY